MSLFSCFIDLLRCIFFCCLSDLESTELDEIYLSEESFKDAASVADKCNEMEDTSEKETNSENEEKKEMSSLQKMPSLPEPILVKEVSDPPTPPVTDVKALPSATLPADKIRPLFKPQLSAGEPVRVYRTSRHLRRPAVEIRPLPAVEEPSLADRIFPVLVAPAGRMQTLPSVKAPLLVRENPTPVSDEVMYLTSSASFQPSEEQKLMIQIDHHHQFLPRSDFNPTLDTLLFDLTPQVVLVDIEIENEYVKYTGRTIGCGEMKTSHHKALVDGIKHPPLKARVNCWMENDSEDQEPVPRIQVDKFQDIIDIHENDSEKEEYDSKIEADIAPQKPRDRKVRLFHVNPSCLPKTETQTLKTCKKRNGPVVFLELVEQKIRRREEKKIRKEKMLLERQQLHERYQHDPKLKHLWVNKHNRFNSSVHDKV